MTSFATREEAEADALRQALEGDDDGEGFTIQTCVCGRTDLWDMPEPEHTKVMAACTRCERKVIPPAGHA